ncbi:MAG: polymer-forming cytoskeletal protein, partial [Lachnospira sp.]|nr:polymer-forming cytoskeletal protein [Lachnospira sp.]
VDSSAVIVGDIKSKSVQINNGATIDGRCSQCYAEVNMDNIFNIKTKKNK